MAIELRYVLRSLLKRPVFSLTVILTLGLGVAATSAAFSVVHGVLLEPLPYPEPDRLVSVWERNVNLRNTVSPANFLAWREEGVFERVAAVIAASGSVTGNGDPERVGAINATADFFPILGATAELGRLFGEDDARSEAEPTAVLSNGFWQRRYGGDPDVIGRILVLNDHSRRIIGVANRGLNFDYTARFNYTGSADVYIPSQWSAEASTSSGRYLQVLGRLRPGSSVAAAQDRMSDLAAWLAQVYPERQTGWDVNVVPLREQIVGDAPRALLILFGAVSFVLLIACANIGNLMLTRATERHQEVAVRSALGASRWRIARQLLLESAVLALFGGALGLILTWWAVSGLLALAPAIPRLDSIRVNGTVLAFAGATTVLAGLLFGLVPALHATRSDLAIWLRGRIGGGRREAKRLRSALVVSEVALSLVLLIGAGLLIRSFAGLLGVGLGFSIDDVVTATVELPAQRYADQHQWSAFFDQLVDRLNDTPGVRAASAITFPPLSGPGSSTDYWANDRPKPAPGEFPYAEIRWIHRDYHETMAIPLIAGRYFNATDRADAPKSVIISESMQREIWPDGNAVGRSITMPWDEDLVAEIVGVVRDVRYNGPGQEPGPMIYWNADQFMAFNNMTIMVRSASDAASVAQTIRSAVHEMDAGLPVYRVRTLRELLSDALARNRFAAISLAAFAGLALMLACIGIYGVMSYVTGQRVQEYGVRIALGAESADVVRMVVGQGARLVLVALAIGLVGTFALSRVLHDLVFEIGTNDPLTFILMSTILTVVAIAACWIPARRAARIDPLTAMRQE